LFGRELTVCAVYLLKNIARINKEMPKNVPIQPTEANLLAGAELYKQHCGVCHGLPLTPKSAIATGMYPKPPLLLEGKGVTDDEPGESYWKIFNGFRLTGMPGFGKSLNETQMWQLALLVANADKLPPSAKAVLVAPAPNVPPGAAVPPAMNPPASSSPALPPSIHGHAPAATTSALRPAHSMHTSVETACIASASAHGGTARTSSAAEQVKRYPRAVSRAIV